jgi:dephospho-CoA kinase
MTMGDKRPGKQAKKGSEVSILRVGVTGGIGSGKTLVCSMFSTLGIPVLSADDIAKELMHADVNLRTRLRALLGASAYGPDGVLDRKFVAGKIFSDTSLQKKVNKLVHPLVEADIEKRFRALQQDGHRTGIVEAALIYEAGFDKHLDIVIVVVAPKEERVRRVMARDRSSVEQVEGRIAAQFAPEKKAQKADYILRNSGSLSDLESSVKFLSTILHTMGRKK